MNKNCCYAFCPIFWGCAREGFRKEHNIEGSVCEDIVCSYCCLSLVACQMKR